MAGISDVVEKIVTSVLLDKEMPWPRRSKANWAFTAFSALLCGAGVILLIVAVERFLETIYRADMAAAITAIILFAAALAVLLASRCLASCKTRQTGTGGGIGETDIKEILDILYKELEEPVRENPKTAVILAALAGYSASRCR